MDTLLINVLKIYQQDNIKKRTIKLIKDLHIPINVICAKSGLSPAGIQQWFSGNWNYTLEKLAKLDNFLKSINY